MTHKLNPTFYGWRIVGASALGMSMCLAPFVFGTFGLFILAFQKEFGWSRGDLSISLSSLILVNAVSMPVAGRLIDRVGARRILILSLLASAVLLAAIPLVVTKVWELTVLLGILGFIAAATTGPSYMVIVSAWFIRHRGLAMGLVMAGSGLGYAYAPALVRYLIDNFSWRIAYLVLAALITCVAVPIIYMVVRESPAELRLYPDGDHQQNDLQKYTSRDVGFALGQILRQREFWVLAVALVMLSFSLHGLQPHFVPLLTDRGMSGTEAAAVVTVLGVTMVTARVLVGFLIDRFFAPRVAIIFICLSLIGLGALAMGAVNAGAFLAAILIAMTLGMEVDIIGYLAGRYFGLKSFGAAFGLLLMAMAMGGSFGAMSFGFSYDRTGSYVDVLQICVVLNVLVIALMSTLRRFPDWSTSSESSARETDSIRRASNCVVEVGKIR